MQDQVNRDAHNDRQEELLEVRCGVDAATRSVVLLERAVEHVIGRGAVALLTVKRLVGVAAGEVVVIILGPILLAAPDAPGNDGKTAEHDCSSDTSNDTSDNLLGAAAHS